MLCDSSTVLTSCSRQLHETVADLLLWCDKIVLEGDDATVDAQQASDIISAITHAVNVRVYLCHSVSKLWQ